VRRYWRLLRYARPYWKGWAGIVVVTLLSTAITLLQPWPLKVLVDYLFGHKEISGPVASIISILPGADNEHGLLAWAVLATLLLFVAASATEVVLTTAWVRVGQGMVYDLEEGLFAHIQRRSLIFHSRASIGDLLSRVTGDSWALHTVVDTLLFAPLHALIVTIGVLWVMWQVDPTLTLISVAVVPFMALASLLLGKPVRLAARARREAQSRIYAHVQRTLAGIPVVQVFAQEKREHRRFSDFARAAIRAERRTALVTSLNSLGSGLISALTTAAILWVGAGHVLEGSLTAGSIILFLSYTGVLQAQLKSFTGIYTALQGASAGVDRVMEVLESEREVRDKVGARALPRARGHVRIEHVTFGYAEGCKPVLSDVSLEALPGQTIAIVGPTGAGKSTLVSLIPRLFDPWSGNIQVDGYDVRDVQVQSIRKQVGLVLQEPFLFPTTIAENIAYGRPDASMGQIEAAARAASAHEFIMNLAEGYDTVVGERGATLSGGERQRIAIARALLKDAPILVLDEPTSALDAHTEELLMEALETLKRGRTTFIIAHRLSTIRDADLIVVMDQGTIVEVGSHLQLVGRDSFYKRLYSFQIETPVAIVAGEAVR
jgi:ATP-binding cassette subfamily B protein